MLNSTRSANNRHSSFQKSPTKNHQQQPLRKYKSRPALAGQTGQNIRHTADESGPPTPPDSDEMEEPEMKSAIFEEPAYGSAGDRRLFADRDIEQTEEEKELARRRLESYRYHFEGHMSKSEIREEIIKQCPVHLDIVTNCLINNEYAVITSISKVMAEYYHRNEEFIIITLTRSDCLYYAGNDDPAYIATITTHQNMILTMTNKHNAARLQDQLQRLLGVNSERGLVKFIPLHEDNIATAGTTLLTKIENKQKQVKESSFCPPKPPKTIQPKRSRLRLSSKSLHNLKASHQTEAPALATVGEDSAATAAAAAVMSQGADTSDSFQDNHKGEKSHKTMSRRRGFMHALGLGHH